MMKNSTREERHLAIAPTTRGFGFAVFEDSSTPIDFGIKIFRKDKNARCISAVEKLIVFYQPTTLVLEDHEATGARRGPRIRKLNQALKTLAVDRKVRVHFISRTTLRKVFPAVEGGTKHAIATYIAGILPKDFADRLPPKRPLWKSEDSRMAIFDAASLALASFHLKEHRRLEAESDGK